MIRLLFALLLCVTGCTTKPSLPSYYVDRPVTEPIVFAEGIVSTGQFESHPGFTPDGRTLYFVRSTPNFTDWKIYVTHAIGEGWSTPVMASFSGTYRDADPYVSPDGKHLYFISDRPVDGTPKDDMDVWLMDLTSTGDWGAPRNLGPPVNSSGNEWYPKLSPTGALYFGSDRPGGYGKTDLYRSDFRNGSFAPPENLGPNVNTSADEYEGCVAPDERFLVFMASGRPDDRGGGDLYMSKKANGQWSAAKPLDGRVNRRGLDISPYLSPDGRYFFFSSMRRAKDIPPGQRPDSTQNGLGDIYQVDVDFLDTMQD